MSEISLIKTLIELAPQLAIAVATFLVIKRALPGDAIKDLIRTIQEINATTIRNTAKTEEHERRLNGHDEDIRAIGQQVQTTIASGRH